MWRLLLGAICIILLIVVALIGIAFVALVIFVWGWWLRIRVKEYQTRRHLVSQGRFRPWSKVSERWAQGRGTLIVQYVTRGGWYHGGPIREWWTEDDLVTDSPLPLPGSRQELDSLVDDAQFLAYSRACLSQYTDVDSGSAVLTNRLKSKGNDRTLRESHTAGKVVVLLPWNDDWWLMRGDIDTILNSGI